MFMKILILTFFLFVAACGGGGGDTVTPVDDTVTSDDETTTSSQKISLESIQSTKPGTIYAALLTGTGFTSTFLNGAFSIVNRNQVQLNGTLVTPHEMKLNISLLGGGDNLITFTSNIDESGNVVSMNIKNGSAVCNSSSVLRIPSTVEAGDVGVLSAFTCNNNKTSFASWRIDGADNGNINVISNVIVKDINGFVFSDSDVVFTLSATGEIIALKLIVRLIENSLTLTLDSV